MDTLHIQLHDIRAAYAAGRLKPVEKSIDVAALEKEQVQSWKPFLPEAEQELVMRCIHDLSSALQATRRGNYILADHLFAVIEEFIHTCKFSPASYLVTQSTLEAAAAYLDYRREQFESGIQRIYRALSIDETLELTHGFHASHLHRLRLLLNLMRLKRYQGE